MAPFHSPQRVSVVPQPKAHVALPLPPLPTLLSAVQTSEREKKEPLSVLLRSPGQHPADKITRNLKNKTKHRAPADQKGTGPRDVLHAEYGELTF